MVWPALIFIFGTCAGSFLNVVMLRSMQRQSVGGRSACPHCQKQLRAWELLPLISFIFLRGKCWRCQGPISVQYPLVEFTTGIIFVLLFTPLPESVGGLITPVVQAIIICLLLILFVIDYYTFFLPDVFVFSLVLPVVILLLWSGMSTWLLMQAGLAALLGVGFLGLLWLFTKGNGIGLGDVKLLLPLGLLLGLKGTVVLLWLAFLVGGVVSLWLLLRRHVSMKTAIPFGPFLAGTAILLLLFPTIPDYLFSLWLP